MTPEEMRRKRAIFSKEYERVRPGSYTIISDTNGRFVSDVTEDAFQVWLARASIGGKDG